MHSPGSRTRTLNHARTRSLACSLTRCRSASNAGIPFAWSDVTVSVGNKGSEVTLLDSLSGYANQGEMLAIMGPSGSGKSTLLDTLSGRKTLGNVQGTIKFGGLKPTQAFVRRYLGYVVQGDDTLLALLTVEEMLRYTAELKLERSVSAEEKQLAVDGVIEVLGLDSQMFRCVFIGCSRHFLAIVAKNDFRIIAPGGFRIGTIEFIDDDIFCSI